MQSTKAIVRRDLTGRSTMRWGTYLKRYGTLYLLLLVPLAFFIIFRYVPMSYILLAFKKNNILKAPWLLDWAKNGGWEWFIKAFNDKNFIDALKNTIILNLLDLVIGTPMPILMALLLNELAFPKFKRFAQTVLYLPHFLSWVIISSLSLRLLATNDGLVNQIFGTNIAFLGTENNWRATYIVLGIWKECGWNTIIYLAALTGISPELYEAAAIDGAGIWQRIIHIMIPAIKKLAGTLLILQIISVFQIMYEPMVLTKGGPDNASLSLMQLMWQYAFGNGNMNYGKASAVAVIVTLILLVMTAIYSYFDRKESDWD